MFASDEAAEKQGIVLNYGGVKFLIARAGGGNKRFAEVFKEKAKPFRYAIDHGQMSEEDSNRLMAEVYAETVVLGWETVVKGEDGKTVLDAKKQPKTVKKVEGKDGKMLDFTVENCTQLLVDLPELFRDIQGMAAKAENFRKEEEAADVGNLSES
jgi:hypothetical protein